MTAALLARLAAATEGSRELDAEIAGILGRVVVWHLGLHAAGWDAPKVPMQLTSWGGERVPCYTSSIDAALTLVPDGYSPNINGPVLHRPLWGCDLRWLQSNSFADGLYASAPTPALAVAIAAFRARGII
jgi:hypothetical protein